MDQNIQINETKDELCRERVINCNTFEDIVSRSKEGKFINTKIQYKCTSYQTVEGTTSTSTDIVL